MTKSHDQPGCAHARKLSRARNFQKITLNKSALYTTFDPRYIELKSTIILMHEVIGDVSCFKQVFLVYTHVIQY